MGLRDPRRVLEGRRGEVVGEVEADDRIPVVVGEGIDQSQDVRDGERVHRNLGRDAVLLLRDGHDGVAHRTLEVAEACDDVVEVHQTLVEAYLVRDEVNVVEEDRDGWDGDVHVEVGEDICR